MNKVQWITIAIGVLIVAGLFLFGRTGPYKSQITNTIQSISPNDITTDSILFHVKETLKPAQIQWMNDLEQSVIRGDIKKQKLDVFHQLAHFWKDSARIFEPYAWYEAEAARLENSEKSLTFAAHLILENLRNEENDRLKKWKALQAKDLFERSLRINDKNDSTIVGLGACYIFGNISDNPMEGILKVRQVVEKDSTNIFAQLVLGHGSLISGQYDRAIDRFGKVLAIHPQNLEAILMMAEVYERKADKANAIKWYSNALPLAPNPNMKTALEKRIEELKK
ncbi:MAG TPA: tetratricopeptide repeat protein [Chitinophagaceae bacterium]|nr:tetratricopeptide repeat protein [Chitinophagaceae bacterium]